MSPRPTARELGIPFDGEPGAYNAITDVPGIEVGHTTIIKGEGPLVIGKGPVRTGVTAIFPLGRQNVGAVPAAWFPFNGNGEMTGTTWIEESGFLEGPILLTNTTSVGTVRDAVIKWLVKLHQAAGRFNPNDFSFSLPVVAETWDGWLNDAFGFHIQEADVVHALESAAGGPVAQGNVGGGTGMVCYDFKGGIGTSSRIVSLSAVGRPSQAVSGSTVAQSASVMSRSGTVKSQSDSVVARSPDHATSPSPLTGEGRGEGASASVSYTLGVLVQANFGNRSDLVVRGVPVGRELPLSEIPRGLSGTGRGSVVARSPTVVARSPDHATSPSSLTRPAGAGARGRDEGENDVRESGVESREPLRAPRSGSILIIIATDAPLQPHQLKRLARRATLGLARTGTIGNNSSGDLFLAFSTAHPPSPSTRPAGAGARGRGEGAASPGLWPLTSGPFLSNDALDPFFAATTEATEEAIINALLAAETLTGRDHHTAHAIPHSRLQEIMQKYNRLVRTD